MPASRASGAQTVARDAARAVAAHRDARRIDAERRRLAHEPLQRIEGIIHGDRKLVLGRKPVIDRCDRTSRIVRELAA